MVLIKHGRKPTVAQCKQIQKVGLNHADWLVVKDCPDRMELVHRYSDRTTKTIFKEV